MDAPVPALCPTYATAPIFSLIPALTEFTSAAAPANNPTPIFTSVSTYAQN